MAVLAYCLMKNHVHLLVETPEPNLGAGMQRLHGLHAQTFNKRHQHSGHLFQGRYGAVVVRNDEQLLTRGAVHRAQPRGGGVVHGPRDWAWGSHAAMVGGTAPAWLDVQRLLGYFGAGGGDPRRRYAEFVESDDPLLVRDRRTRSDAWAATSAPAALPASLANAAVNASSSSK